MSACKRMKSGLLVFGLIVCASALAVGQDFRGSIAGRVTEASGAAVVGDPGGEG